MRQQVQQAQTATQQAELEREQTRQRLLTQLNQVLQTKDSARGLIVNMSDVLFDFNKATLKPGARERLARVSGIVLAYPDLQLQVEGYTDNVGSDSYNMTLSDKRAAVVRDYLVSQGVNAGNVQCPRIRQDRPGGVERFSCWPTDEPTRGTRRLRRSHSSQRPNSCFASGNSWNHGNRYDHQPELHE